MAKEIVINRNICILLGEEIGNKASKITQLIELARSKFGTVDVHRYYAHDINGDEIVSLLQTSSLFGGFRFVQLYNCESLKKADIDLLCTALEREQPDLTIILLTDEYKIDKRLEALCHPSQKQVFYELNEAQKKDFIKSYFREAHKDITSEAIERILELVDNNTQEIKTACGALANFYQSQTIINEDNVDELIIYSKDETVFTLFNKLCQKNLEGSAEIVLKLSSGNDGLSVYSLTMLASQYRKLLSFKEDIKTIPSEQAFRQNVIFGKKNQAFFKEASNLYSLNEIKKILVLINQIDTLMRSGVSHKDMQRIAIEKLINQICSNGVLNYAVNIAL